MKRLSCHVRRIVTCEIKKKLFASIKRPHRRSLFISQRRSEVSAPTEHTQAVFYTTMPLWEFKRWNTPDNSAWKSLSRWARFALIPSLHQFRLKRKSYGTAILKRQMRLMVWQKK